MIPYTSILIGITDIETRNKAFNALDKETQRREIALDSLQLVLTSQVYAHNAGYWDDHLYAIKEPDSKLFQNILINKLPECRVCQRGLMMLSQIRLGNELASNDSSIYCGNNDNIKGFSIDDFEGMESEYEGETIDMLDEDDNNIDNSLPFKKHSWQKLANICCNVIANGNFVINDENDYLQIWNLTRENKPQFSTQ